MTPSATIVWHGIYLHGHEYCRVFAENDNWKLAGAAVFRKDESATVDRPSGTTALPAYLKYDIECDSRWRSRRGHVAGHVGDQKIDLHIAVLENQSWFLNDIEQPQVAGCIDIDLNFSPSTNLLPIRRWGLSVGEQQTVKAAWLRFPSFKLEALEQTYARVDQFIYRYESGGGTFTSELKVNDFGLVTSYPGIWEEEPG